MTRKNKAALLLTLGDPNGLGPELVCRLLGAATDFVPKRALVLVGPEQVLHQHCSELDLPVFWHSLNKPEASELKPGQIYCYTPPELKEMQFTPGQASTQGGQAAGCSLDLACSLLQSDFGRALITCPLHKDLLQSAGYNFSGHTEFLASRFNLSPEQVCMHLYGPSLRVSLVTTHPPLYKVAQEINKERVLRCLLLTWEFMQSLGLQDKPVAVCGLNPHAGEEGRIGREEIDIIAPALEQGRGRGVQVVGPLPADTVFYRTAVKKEFSAVLAMYHDQGLGPLKLVHFNRAVNVTLGLPVVRTSVDHGTGFELVGSGQASTRSLHKSIILAGSLLGHSGY